jgi:Family of unknown function (DUF5372)
VIVHPFHVLFGRRVTVLFAKRRAGKVVFVCEGGPLGRVTVPLAWTDRCPTRAGQRLVLAGLVELDTLVKLLGNR